MTAVFSYQPVFCLDVFHPYTVDGTYPAFTLTPLPHTSRAMTWLGLYAGQVGNRFSIYLQTGGPAPRAVLARPVPDLLFLLRFTDLDFARYTDWPVQPGCLPVFTGRPAGSKSRSQRLTAGRCVSTADLLPLRAGVFDYPLPAAMPPTTPCWLVAADGEKIGPISAFSDGKLRVDCHHLSEGLYVLENSRGKFYNFFLTRSRFSLPVCGFVSISCGEMLNGLEKTGLSGARKYTSAELGDTAVHTLSFQVRSTVWRYDISNYAGADPGEFTVRPVSGHYQPGDRRGKALPSVAFRRVPGIAGPGGEVSIAFESTASRPIPMHAQPRQKFQLWRQGRALIDPLPTPDLTLARSSRGTLCSNMFVSL